MLGYRMIGREDGGTDCVTTAEGQEVLRHPLLNKGTAFPPEERLAFGIDGYLPPAVSTLDLRLSRCHEAYGAKKTDLERHIYLRSLQDRNEVLFYALLERHLEEMMRIIRTPTVGEACQKFSHIYRFVQAVKRHFPSCLPQWEDFSKENAWSLLEKCRGELLSFNDHIQGTGAVVLTGIVCAVRDAGQRLRDQVYVLYGSGAAGIGVAAQIRTALVAEGLTAAEAAARIHVLDSRGLLVEGRARIEDYKLPFTHPRELVPAGRIARRCVFPAIGALQGVCRDIAVVVARTAVAQGLASDQRAAADIEAAIDRRIWKPAYPRLVHGPVTP